jgi:predicted type IV restriction endonuclease
MLKVDIEQIREAIRLGLFTNEAAISQGIVLSILHALSWPTYDTRIVSPEYSVEGRRVDFALCHPLRSPSYSSR